MVTPSENAKGRAAAGETAGACGSAGAPPRAYDPLAMPHELGQELRDYYANIPLMWRNVLYFTLLSAGWALCFTVVSPLMTLRMNSPQIGMGDRAIGFVNAANSYVVSYLVMYFSWKSDHTITRWGRRIPFLWISAPGIILSVVLFPFVSDKWMLLGIGIVQLFFMDMKNSTISLLPIDLVPRRILARVGSVGAIPLGLLTFLALRYGMRLSEYGESLPYLIGAGVMIVTTLVAGLNIREPPIRKPATGPFKPWSPLKVGCHDRRVLLLMFANAGAGAASMMVARSAHPAEVGSVTSSLALINNLFAGTLVWVSGCLIQGLGGNYKVAFLLGLGVSAVGFALLLFYRHAMIRGGPLRAAERGGTVSYG